MEYKELGIKDHDELRWSTGRLVIGTLSMALFILIFLQSCVVGVGNVLFSSGEMSGTAGVLIAILMLASGIVGVITRNTSKIGGPISCTVMYWFNFFLSRVASGNYKDLRIWGFMAFIFGTVYLISAMRTKKAIIIGSIVSAVYLILGLI